jgi:hypothetical protein
VVKNLTALANEIRGLLHEFGFVIAQVSRNLIDSDPEYAKE